MTYSFFPVLIFTLCNVLLAKAQSSPLNGSASLIDLSGKGTCGVDNGSSPYNIGLSRADLGAPYNKDSQTCGTCIKVTSSISPVLSVILKVTTLCPNCKPGDIGLSSVAFKYFSPGQSQSFNVAWTNVPCPSQLGPTLTGGTAQLGPVQPGGTNAVVPSTPANPTNVYENVPHADLPVQDAPATTYIASPSAQTYPSSQASQPLATPEPQYLPPPSGGFPSSVTIPSSPASATYASPQATPLLPKISYPLTPTSGAENTRFSFILAVTMGSLLWLVVNQYQVL